MQANAEQQVLRRGDRALQLASNCDLPLGTRFYVQPNAIRRGFDSDNVDICRGTKVRFSDGAVYKDDLGGAIAYAQDIYGCTDITLVPFFQQLSGGQDGLDYANSVRLPPGFVVTRFYNDDGAIARVNIYSKTGDWYCNYHLLAPLGIDIATITCPFWQERLRNAVANHLPNDGWSIVLRNNGYVGYIFSPSGDEFRSLQAAWVTAGVIFPPQLLLEAMREFIRIVESLTNGSVTQAVFVRLIDIPGKTVKRFLSNGPPVNLENIYKINLVFGPNYDVDALSDAARDAGVLEEQIRSFEFDMTAYMQRLSLRARAFPLPEPHVRANERTNEYEGWANANAPRVMVGQQLNQIQEAVVAEAPINQVGLPPLPLAFQGAAAEAINQVGPHLQAQAQVQVNPPQDAEEEPANFVAV